MTAVGRFQYSLYVGHNLFFAATCFVEEMCVEAAVNDTSTQLEHYLIYRNEHHIFSEPQVSE